MTLTTCPMCGGSGCQDDTAERCQVCNGQGQIEDEGPPSAPAGDARGYLAMKPCGCCVEWISYGLSGSFATEKLTEWRAKGWEVLDGLKSQLSTCHHQPGGAK